MRFGSIILLLLAAVLACRPPVSSAKPPVPRAGELDIRDWNFDSDGPITLDGEWSIAPGQLVAPGEPFPGQATALVPNFFSDDSIQAPDFYHATYRLRILGPGDSRTLLLNIQNIYSAYRVFVDGRELAAAGVVGTSRETGALMFRPAQVEVVLSGPVTELIIQVSNYHHRKGGLRGPLRLGNIASITGERRQQVAMSLFSCGSLLLMGLYQLIQFLLLRRGRASLYFSLACLLLALRSLLVSERFIFDLLPGITDGVLLLRIEYLTTYLQIAMIGAFFQNLFPKEIHRFIIYLLILVYLPLCLLVILTPVHIYTYGIYGHWFTSMLGGVYILIGVIVAAFRRRPGALVIVGGLLALVLSGVNDNLYYAGIIDTVELASLGMLVLIFSQSVLLAMRYVKTLFRSESLAEDLAANNKELVATNAAVTRFVPRDFLTHLKRDSLVDVELGDQTEKEMTVLFSDIRDFTSLSESMTPQENFNFINSYLKRMEPLIGEHRGFIDKYIGDAIMALFDSMDFADGPGTDAGADAAVQASLAMLAALVPYNEGRAGRGYQPIRIGIGLNTGRLMLGTVGGDNRMDGTVISDAVNLAARIEGMCKLYGASLLITEYTRARLRDPAAYQMRPADRVIVKGRSDPVTVYEVFGGEPPEIRAAKLRTLPRFEGAYEQYLRGEFPAAVAAFESLLVESPDDLAADRYLQRSRYFQTHGRPVDWDGVFKLQEK